jgi:hypothetical protein
MCKEGKILASCPKNGTKGGQTENELKSTHLFQKLLLRGTERIGLREAQRSAAILVPFLSARDLNERGLPHDWGDRYLQSAFLPLR